jgi:hypothetical protein
MDRPVSHSDQKKFHVEVTVHRLAPDEGLSLGRGEHTLVVREGVVYVSLHSGDVALIPGDEIVVHPADFRGAWSEARDEAELVVLRGG